MKAKWPLVRAELFSHHLDVRDLQSLPGTGNPPSPPKATTAPGEDVPSAALTNLELTQAVNIQMRFEGQTVILANQTLHNVSTDLALQDGHLTLAPVLHLANGVTRAQIDIEDQGEAPLHMLIRAEMVHINVQQALAALGMEYEATGSIDGQMDLATSGRSLSQLVSSLMGK